MGKEDSRTWIYIENIVGFLSSSNAHMIYDNGQTAKIYRPKGVGFEIDINNLYDKFNIIGKGKLDIIYIIDSTAPMDKWIKGVKNKCKEFFRKLNEILYLKIMMHILDEFFIVTQLIQRRKSMKYKL